MRKHWKKILLGVSLSCGLFGVLLFAQAPQNLNSVGQINWFNDTFGACTWTWNSQTKIINMPCASVSGGANSVTASLVINSANGFTVDGTEANGCSTSGTILTCNVFTVTGTAASGSNCVLTITGSPLATNSKTINVSGTGNCDGNNLVVVSWTGSTVTVATTLSGSFTGPGTASYNNYSPFTSTAVDGGKSIALFSVATTDNYHNVAATSNTGTIASVTNGTTAVLSFTPGTPITTGGYARFGTDQTNNLRAGIKTVCNTAGGFNSSGTGTVYLPPSPYALIVGPTGGTVGLCSNLRIFGGGSQASKIWFLGVQTTYFLGCTTTTDCADGHPGTSTARDHNFSLDNISIDMSGSPSGTYNVNKKLLQFAFVQNIAVHDMVGIGSIASMINIDDSNGGLLYNSFLYNCGRGNNGASLGGSCLGWGTTSSTDNVQVTGNYFNGAGAVNNVGRSCAFAESEGGTHGTMTATGNYFTNCNVALGEAGGFGSNFTGNTFFANYNDIKLWEGTVGAEPGQKNIVDSNVTQNSVGDSIIVDVTGGVSNAVQNTICNNRITNPGADGIHLITSATHSINTINLCNNDIYSATTNGIEASGGTLGVVDWDMRGNNIQDTPTAIEVSVPVTRGNWSQNRAWNSTGSLAVTGLQITTGNTVTDLIIGPNDFTKVTTTPYTFTGVTWAGESQVIQNIGTLFSKIPANLPAGSQWVTTDVSNAATYNSTVAAGSGTPGAGTYFDLIFDGTNWKAH